MSDDRVPVRAMVDRHKKEAAMDRLEHGGLSREIRKTIDRLAGTGDSERDQLQAELDRLRDERDEAVRKRNRWADTVSELNAKIERRERRLDELRDREGEYEGYLQAIEQAMHEDGMRVFPDHGQIQDAASVGDCEPDAVIADLRERNPDLPDRQFEAAGQ